MFSQIFARFQSQKKQDGAILLITVILSGIMITIGLGVSTLLIKEIKITTNFYFSEKAYYAAESGVEEAVLALNESAVSYAYSAPPKNSGDLDNPHRGTDDLDGAKEYIQIWNLSDDSANLDSGIQEHKEITIPPYGNIQLSLKYDNDENLVSNNFNSVLSQDLSIELSSKDVLNENLSWKVRCAGSANDSISISGVTDDFSIWNGTLKSKIGNYDNINRLPGEKSFIEGSVQNFLDEEVNDLKTCYLSLTSFQGSPIAVKFLGGKIAPYEATIKAIGVSGGKQKIISFKHKQNAIPTMISEFGLFHCDEGASCFGNE